MSEVVITNSTMPVEFPDSATGKRASPDSARAAGKEGGNVLSPSFSSVPTEVVSTERTHHDISEAVQEAIAEMNEYIQSTQRALRFTIDPELGETIVKVVDRQTEEVVRQIPNEIFLELARSLRDQQPLHFLSDQA